ncbi:MAG: DEAD/DEAH box helicase [Synergistaceae bacterium]|nr:DEAD/DEAH box helicase [Synergistaceae bacterium]
MTDLFNDQNTQIVLSKLLGEITKYLSTFLERELTSLFEDWWNQAVADKLTFQQRRRVEERGISSLDALDLAALLRVLDQNWYQISSKLSLTSESRNFAKEMQTIRNRWAHTTTEGFPIDDVYRDLDTLQRFASVIEANETLIQEVQFLKTAFLIKKTESSLKIDDPNLKPSHSNEESGAEFELGQIVCVRSNPTNHGAVILTILSKPENRFKVFMNGEAQTFYASQLQAENVSVDDTESFLCEQFHAYLTALQIRYPNLSTLYSLNAARIDFIPYQFRPVLRFIKSDRPRLLIADGVGVGKTIEAGLILRELQARRDIQSVLIVCPRPLVTERKWMNEMKRFGERFTHLDGGTLRYCINEMDLEGVWPEQHQKVIVPYSLFDEVLLYGSVPDGKRKRKKGLLDLDPFPRFDLVIVDEAHHIRNQNTFSHKAVRFFCDHAEAVLFLTATPIQLGSHDLFVLLNTLRPDLIIDKESFTHMAEPNPYINQAIAHVRNQETEWQSRAYEALEQAAATPWGQSILRHNPNFIRIRSRLSEGNVTNEERVEIITELESMHTFAGIINRTRRRDIDDFTIRKPETVVVPFTPSQQGLHDELLRIQADIFTFFHGDNNVKFMMTTIRRQAASCLYGLAPFLETILNRHFDELSWEEADNAEDVPPNKTVDAIQSQIQSILDSLRLLDPYDPKLEALRVTICNKQKLPNNKVMLFSSFRHTLKYLYDHLKEDGFRIGMIHGGTPDEDRVELRRRFERHRDDTSSLDVLLFSEIGCEGLDYQFCDCIVNYDLPWNPMRVEQRIGRIDRKGQKSESVAIINLVTPGTVDADIYERCLMRIGVFNSALGGSEEILGDITKEIRDIAENYTLNEEERRGKFDQLSDNKIRLIQEEAELEQRQKELFGIQLPEDRMKKEIEDASSYWLSSASMLRIVTLYLQKACGKEQEFILGEKPLKTLRLSQDARSILLKDYQQLSRQNTIVYREWENWLKGGSPHMLLTFESDCATQHPEASFIMPQHPLVKQAAASFDIKKRVVASLKVYSTEVPAGLYEFAIYQWHLHGIKEDLVLQPVSSSDQVTLHLSRLLEIATDLVVDDPKEINPACWDELDAQHYNLWSDARAKHREETQDSVEYKRESLSTSHRARISLLEEKLRQSSNAKIQKMYQSQISTAEADYARHTKDLDFAIEKADVIAEPVAYGVIQIVGDGPYVK